MARMLGRMHQPHCPSCHGAPGVDCPDVGKDSRQAKRAEARTVGAEVNAEILEIADRQIARWRGALDMLADR